MIVYVKLFARARQLMESDTVQVKIPAAAKVDELRRALVDQHPPLAELNNHWMIAVDAEYAGLSTTLNSDSEIALIAPVSGG